MELVSVISDGVGVTTTVIEVVVMIESLEVVTGVSVERVGMEEVEGDKTAVAIVDVLVLEVLEDVDVDVGRGIEVMVVNKVVVVPSTACAHMVAKNSRALRKSLSLTHLCRSTRVSKGNT